MRLIKTLLPTIALFIVMTLPAAADSGYALGWTYMPMAAGFTVKSPISQELSIQPVFSVSLYDGDGQTEDSYSVGLRGTYSLPVLRQVHPYLGLGLGHQRSFLGADLSQTIVDESRTGATAFIGLEYRKYALRPAVELGLTALRRTDGSFRVGNSINAGIYYYF